MEDPQYPDIQAEQIGRIDRYGRVVYLEEEQRNLDEQEDFGHYYSATTRDQRSIISKKGYSSLENSASENL